MIVLPEAFQFAIEVVGAAVFAQNFECPFADAFLRVGDELGDVDLRYLSQSVAFGAGTIGGVEREGVGLWFGIGMASGGVHE